MTKQTDHDAHQALQAGQQNGWAYIGKGTIPAAANGDRIQASDEAEDIPLNQSVMDDLIDFCKGALILAVCTGLLGFVAGRYFY